jgi:hypothetical protein
MIISSMARLETDKIKWCSGGGDYHPGGGGKVGKLPFLYHLTQKGLVFVQSVF